MIEVGLSSHGLEFARIATVTQSRTTRFGRMRSTGGVCRVLAKSGTAAVRPKVMRGPEKTMWERRRLNRVLFGPALSIVVAGGASADRSAVATSVTAPVVLTAYLLLEPLELIKGRYSAAECDGNARYALSSSGFATVASRGGQESATSKGITALVSCLRVFSDHSVLVVVAAPGGDAEGAIMARANILQHFKMETRQALKPSLEIPQ